MKFVVLKFVGICALFFCMHTYGASSGNDVSSVFGVQLGAEFSHRKLQLPVVENAPYPAHSIRAPIPSELSDIFYDFRVGVSLLSGNVFQISAERVYSDHGGCESGQKLLQSYLEELYGRPAMLNKQFQFASLDDLRWVQFACGLRQDSKYWTLSLTVTDTAEEEAFKQWLANKRGLGTR